MSSGRKSPKVQKSKSHNRNRALVRQLTSSRQGGSDLFGEDRGERDDSSPPPPPIISASSDAAAGGGGRRCGRRRRCGSRQQQRGRLPRCGRRVPRCGRQPRRCGGGGGGRGAAGPIAEQHLTACSARRMPSVRRNSI